MQRSRMGAAHSLAPHDMLSLPFFFFLQNPVLLAQRWHHPQRALDGLHGGIFPTEAPSFPVTLSSVRLR